MDCFMKYRVHWLVLFTLISYGGGDLCYRKIKDKRGKTVCKGPLKRTFPNIRSCCSSRKGVAFALTKVRLGKNIYKCSSCRDLGLFKTPKLSSLKKSNKKSKVSRGGWGPWGACSSTCGAGWRRRVRLCAGCDITDSINYRIEPCIVNFYCPVHGNWGPWQPWRPCNQPCEGGIQDRTRHCNYPAPSHSGKNCDSFGYEQRACNIQPCQANMGWMGWGPFGECSVTCGKGTRTRTRLCGSSNLEGGEKLCLGVKTQQRRCSLDACPPEGAWSEWEAWGLCTVSCGEGSRTRHRTCDSSQLGACHGRDTDRQRCYTGVHCTVVGGWASWTSYSPCTGQSCSGQVGYQIRSRLCDNPAPRYGGKYCEGAMFSTVSCVNQEGCPVNGSWCEWSPWTSCPVTCITRQSTRSMNIYRRRTCTCPSPQNDGTTCKISQESPTVEMKECVNVPKCQQVSAMTTSYTTLLYTPFSKAVEQRQNWTSSYNAFNTTTNRTTTRLHPTPTNATFKATTNATTSRTTSKLCYNTTGDC